MNATDITTRWINLWEATESELAQVEFVRESHGWTPFAYNLTRVLLAEVDGKIIGMQFLQLVAHPEPHYVDPKFRASSVSERLATEVIVFLRECAAPAWQCTADSPFAEKLCAARGMVPVEAPVYKGGA